MTDLTFLRQTSIFELLPIWQVLERLKIERQKELLRGSVDIRRPAPRRPWPCSNQTTRVRSPLISLPKMSFGPSRVIG